MVAAEHAPEVEGVPLPPLGQISPSQAVQDYITLPSPRESGLWSLLFLSSSLLFSLYTSLCFLLAKGRIVAVHSKD